MTIYTPQEQLPSHQYQKKDWIKINSDFLHYKNHNNKKEKRNLLLL